MLKWAVAGLVLCMASALAGSVIDIGSLAGVYKHTRMLGQLDGPDFRAEDVLEIVKLSGGKAYFRTRLLFYNGHSCSLYGVADAGVGGLVYRKRVNEGGECVLTIRVDGARLVFADEDNVCQLNFCGMRGRFNGNGFDLAGRRRIRYLKRLKASSEFADAMAEAGIGR